MNHFVVQSIGQESQVIHGVFGTEQEAVALADRLMVEFHSGGRYDSPLGWASQSRLEVQKWDGTRSDDIRIWRNMDEYSDGGVWIDEEEYYRQMEEREGRE